MNENKTMTSEKETGKERNSLSTATVILKLVTLRRKKNFWKFQSVRHFGSNFWFKIDTGYMYLCSDLLYTSPCASERFCKK